MLYVTTFFWLLMPGESRYARFLFMVQNDIPYLFFLLKSTFIFFIVRKDVWKLFYAVSFSLQYRCCCKFWYLIFLFLLFDMELVHILINKSHVISWTPTALSAYQRSQSESVVNLRIKDFESVHRVFGFTDSPSLTQICPNVKLCQPWLSNCFL